MERERRASLSRSLQNTENLKASGMELRHQSVPEVEESGRINSMSDIPTDNANSSARASPFDNGYQFPPKHTWGESTKIFLVAFWKFFTTPIGFLVTIYGLNVVSNIRAVKFCLFQTFSCVIMLQYASSRAKASKQQHILAFASCLNIPKLPIKQMLTLQFRSHGGACYFFSCVTPLLRCANRPAMISTPLVESGSRLIPRF